MQREVVDKRVGDNRRCSATSWTNVPSALIAKGAFGFSVRKTTCAPAACAAFIAPNTYGVLPLAAMPTSESSAPMPRVRTLPVQCVYMKGYVPSLALTFKESGNVAFASNIVLGER